MFDRPEHGERALCVYLVNEAEISVVDEFRQLALSAGATICAEDYAVLHRFSPKYLIGKGKVDELACVIEAECIQLVLFDATLSPTQQRNLEKVLKCRVLDRTGLILDIFALRAQSFEGKLQVELAQLKHLSTRLVRGWTHLERQKGGIGLRGPGEKQLESDRRLLKERIKYLSQRLKRVKSQRKQSRSARIKRGIPTVSLVGYTNSGKSTLFNWVTHSSVYAKDQLFATLDPTIRSIDFPSMPTIVLADTVGFIRDLPHDLVAAFRATLEETVQADLLLHVVDCSSEQRFDQIREVNKVLEEMGANDISTLMVHNKVDMREDVVPGIDYDEAGRPRKVWISAKEQQGLNFLLQAISERLWPDKQLYNVTLPVSEGRKRAALYKLGAIKDEQIDEQGNQHLTLWMSSVDFKKWFH